MRILVVGAGSTGGYFGGRLAEAGVDVSFLVRPARAAQLRRDGLRLVSPHGDATLAPKLVIAGAITAPYDAVLLAVKAFALDAAITDMAPAIGPATMILPVLNGMRHVDILTDRFGRDALIGGVCKIAALVDPEGRIVQLNKMQDLAYGEMNGAITERITRLDATLQQGGFTARLSPDVAREMWEKWILLASLGAITCLMRGSIGAVVAAPGGDAFARAILAEIVHTVSTVGRAPSEGFLAAATTQLTQPGSPMTSSMYRDLQAGASVEAEQIIGDLAARAHQAGIATPLLDTAFTHLSVYHSHAAAPR